MPSKPCSFSMRTAFMGTSFSHQGGSISASGSPFGGAGPGLYPYDDRRGADSTFQPRSLWNPAILRLGAAGWCEARPDCALMLGQPNGSAKREERCAPGSFWNVTNRSATYFEVLASD